MVRRKVPVVKVVLSVEARKQVVSLFALLVQIGKRVKPKKQKPPKPKTKENDITGPQKCGPCFLVGDAARISDPAFAKATAGKRFRASGYEVGNGCLPRRRR